MKKLITTQKKYNEIQKKATLSNIKLANITLKTQLLENQKKEINAKITSNPNMTSKEKKKLTKKSAKRTKKLAKLKKKKKSRDNKAIQINEVLTRTTAKLKERKELAGITNKVNMTPAEKQVSEQREKNFINLVQTRKAAPEAEKIRKQDARDLSLSTEITRNTDQLNKLTKKKAKQNAKEENRKKTGKKLGFFEKMFNGFRKKVSKSNIRSKKNEIGNLSSQIGKNSKTVVERIKSGAKNIKNFFTLKTTLERRKKQAKEVEKALQESQV